MLSLMMVRTLQTLWPWMGALSASLSAGKRVSLLSQMCRSCHHVTFGTRCGCPEFTGCRSSVGGFGVSGLCVPEHCQTGQHGYQRCENDHDTEVSGASPGWLWQLRFRGRRVLVPGGSALAGLFSGCPSGTGTTRTHLRLPPGQTRLMVAILSRPRGRRANS
jgi:hypothetical protein